MTGNLLQRVAQHREGTIAGFAKKYELKRLVYYEVFEDPTVAIRREKGLKTWLPGRRA
jgi:putative endonuclease